MPYPRSRPDRVRRLLQVWRMSCPARRQAVMLAILPLSAVQAADTYYFKDILRASRPRAQPVHEACRWAILPCLGDLLFRRCEEVRAMHARSRLGVDRYVPDPKTRVAAGKRSSTYIDPDTGMSCRNVGGVAICVPRIRRASPPSSLSQSTAHCQFTSWDSRSSLLTITRGARVAWSCSAQI